MSFWRTFLVLLALAAFSAVGFSVYYTKQKTAQAAVEIKETADSVGEIEQVGQQDKAELLALIRAQAAQIEEQNTLIAAYKPLPNTDEGLQVEFRKMRKEQATTLNRIVKLEAELANEMEKNAVAFAAVETGFYEISEAGK